MGIKDFTKVFASSGQVTFKDLAQDDLAVDAFLELFRGSSMQHAAKLVNPAGESTLYLTVALANAVKRKALGCDDIWCWDSRDPRKADDPKQKTLADRAAIRRTNQEEMKRLSEKIEKHKILAKKVSREQLLKIDPTFDITLKADEDQLETLKSRNPESQHFSSMVRNVQFLLTKLGIRMAIAPIGCDAEKLGAQLCREGVCDGVLTTDTDALAYGAQKQIKKIAGKTGKYDLYVLADCLKQHDITYQQLVEISTVLGCDFCEKTSGIGPGTVVKKIKSHSVEYTAEQKAAQANFMDHRSVVYEYIEPTCTNESLDELKAWLIKIQGFRADRVEKTLNPFYV